MYGKPCGYALISLFFSSSAGAGAMESEHLFMDEFRAGPGEAWQVATWPNGSPFGGIFASDNVRWEDGGLSLGFDGASGTCAEIRTRRFWQYGRFEVEMKPAAVPGTVSSFFLYAGVAATASHHEIDIEFIGGKPLLHTNVWAGGKPAPRDIDLAAMGIDPFAAPRRYGVVWKPEEIIWQVMDDAGQWRDVRVERTSLSAPMQLMMNAWFGDNREQALAFPGRYQCGAGSALYRRVLIGG